MKRKSEKSSYFLWQKIVSVFCCIIILAPLAIKIPDSYAAPNRTEKNLVAILVSQELIENKAVPEKIQRYAQDIQNTLPITKSLILPIPKETSAGDIFSVLERLYLEGYPSANGYYRLSGVILIGNLPLPVIRTRAIDASSVFPLTDFEDPEFLWDEISHVFRENDESSQLRAEIFHGVIRAPGSNEKTEEQWLTQFFDKNHAFHIGELPSADQKLFFADLTGEAGGLDPFKKKMYEAGHSEFLSDMTFLRYNQSFLDDINTLYQFFSSEVVDFSVLPEKMRKKIDELRKSMTDFPVPDSFAYKRIQQLLPSYMDAVEGYLSKALLSIRDTGRWSVEENTADTIPALITEMDTLSREYIRRFSVQMEQKITEYVEKNWQKPVPVLDQVFAGYLEKKKGSIFPFSVFDSFLPGNKVKGLDSALKGIFDDYDIKYNSYAVNYHGLKASEVKNAFDCQLYRGSKTDEPRKFGEQSQLTEMNHLWNKFPKDSPQVYTDQCQVYGRCCIMFSQSPEQCSPGNALVNVFDYKGGKINNAAAEPSFLDCALNASTRDIAGFRYPQESNWISYTDWLFSNVSGWDRDWIYPIFQFHNVSSVVVQDEPRPETISKAIEDTLSGSIPADEIRKITFQSQSGSFMRIDFPDIFSLPDDRAYAEYGDVMEMLKKLYSEKEQEMREKMLYANIESYIHYINAVQSGIRHRGTLLVPFENPTKLPLAQQVSEFFRQATDEIRKHFSREGDSSISNLDLWMRYLPVFLPETLEKTPDFEENENILVLDQKITNIAAELLKDTKAGNQENVPNSSIGVREFFEGAEKEIAYYPYAEYPEFPEGNLNLKESITFPIHDIPPAGFLFGEAASDVETTAGDIMPYYLQWQALSADEKHKKTIELFFGEDPLRKNLGGPDVSYEYGAFRAGGNSNEVWWQEKDLIYLPGDDPEWDEALPETRHPARTGDGKNDDKEKDKCGSDSDGVSILEWLPAFMCWMNDTLSKPVQVELSNECNYTNTLDFGDSDEYDQIMSPTLPEIEPGSKLYVTSSLGTELPVGIETDIEISFRDANDEPIVGGKRFEVEADEGVKVLSGLQKFSDVSYSGDYSFGVKIVSSPATVTVSSDGFPKITLRFEPVKNGKIVLQKGNIQNQSLHEIFITVTGDHGQTLTDFSSTAMVAVSDESFAHVPVPEARIENGVGKALVQLSTPATIIVTVTTAGFSQGEITLFEGDDSFVADRLMIRNIPDAIGLGESVDVDLLALDQTGKERFVPIDATMFVTEKTKDILKIQPRGNGKFTITGGNSVGSARIIAEHSGLLTAVAEVEVVDKITKEDFKRLQPNSLITSLLGSDFANFSQNTDPIANTILFSGRSQAVISSLNRNIAPFPEVSVNREGAVQVFRAGAQVSTSSLSPLKVRVYDELRSLSLAEYALSFPERADITVIEDTLSSLKESGIFFENFDESGTLHSQKEGDHLTIFYDGIKAVTAFSDGSFAILDNRFSLRFQKNTELPALSLVFQNNVVAGAFTLVGATMTPLEFPVDSAAFFPIMGNENGSLGFVIEGNKDSFILPSGGKAMEQAVNVFASGFNEDDNFALQLGSGSAIGNAAKFGFGPSGILLGDPTVSLSTDQKLVSGFNRGIGEEIYRNSVQKNDFVVSFDFESDDLPDILVASRIGDIRLIKNMGNLQFRDRGLFLKSPQKISGIAVADLNSDLHDDVLVLDSGGKITAYQNIRKRLELFSEMSLPKNPIESIQIEDFDKDLHPDILAYEKSGDVSVYWGDLGGFLEEKKTVVGSFGAKIDETNLALDNTMISMPNISEAVTNVFPLILGKNASEEDGVETAESYRRTKGGSEISDATDAWSALRKSQESYPDSFSQDFSGYTPSDTTRTGLFAPLSNVPNITVSLFASDENGGALQEKDTIRFTLRVGNTSSENMHFTLAHTLNPAFEMNSGEVNVPDSWPVQRPIPILGEGGLKSIIHIFNIRLNPGETEEMYFSGSMKEKPPAKLFIRENLDFPPENPSDGLSDITVLSPGINGVLHYLSDSKNHRNFVPYFEKDGEMEIPEFLKDMEDADRDGTPDKFTKDKNGDGIYDSVEQVLNPFRDDTDQDGVPDEWDETAGNFDEANSGNILGDIGSVVDTIMEYTNCNGGCLNIPINFAFLVPGEINIFESIASNLKSALGAVTGGASSAAGGATELAGAVGAFAPGIAQGISAVGDAISEIGNMVGDQISSLMESLSGVQNALGFLSGTIPFGFPIFGLLEFFPFVCTLVLCNSVYSYFRLYLSPTLTGGIGIGICIGPFTPATVPSAVNTAYCIVFAPPVLNICNFDFFKGKKKKYTFVDDYGNCSLVGEKRSPIQATGGNASGLKGLLFWLDDVGEFSFSYNTGNSNNRVMTFPWNWIYKQAAEFHAMLTTLPNITLYYPDFSAFSLDEITETAKKAGNDLKMFGDEMVDAASDFSLEDTVNQAGAGLSEVGSDTKKVFRHITGDDEKLTEKEVQEMQKKYAKDFQNFKENAQGALGTFEELYEAFSAIPLVQLDPVPVYIKVPYISRAHIFALMNDLEKWIEDAEEEIKQAKSAWANCPENAAVFDGKRCQAIKAVTDKIIVNSDRLVATAKLNISLLKSYLNLGNLIANLDMMATQWLSQVICFLDNTILYLASWFIKNKRRLEMWIELYYLMDALREIWDEIKNIFIDYEMYCAFCKADRGGSDLSIFNIIFDFVIGSLVIRFPRLPDIVIDLSQIKGGITIPVPEPKLHFVPILFPKLPRLDLIGPPLLEIRLPGIPKLPDFPILTALPPFPPTPKITLPNLPPAPRLPDIPGAIADILSLIRVILFVWCLLFKRWEWPVGETTGMKALIEGLTARPNNKMFSFDFIGSLFPEIVIPSVRRIEVNFEVNLDFNLGESLVNIMRDIFEPWNDAVTDLRQQASSIGSEINSSIREAGGGAHVTPGEVIDLKDVFSGASENENLLAQFGTQFSSLFASYFSKDQKFYSAAEIRQKMGYEPIRLSDTFPAIEQIKALRKNVVALQNELMEERKQILAHGDITRLKGSFVADSELASRVYNAVTTAALPDLDSFKNIQRDDSVSKITVDIREPAQEFDESSSSSTIYQSTEPRLIRTNARDIFGGNTVAPAPEEIINKEGLYAQCANETGEITTERIILSESFTDRLESTLIQDMDADGDEDMMLWSRYSIFLKENYGVNRASEHLDELPEIRMFSDFIPVSEAVKNVFLRPGSAYSNIRFSVNFDDDLLGVAIIAREIREEFFSEEKPEENGEKYTMLLLPTRYVPQGNDSKHFSVQQVPVEGMVFSGNVLVREFTKQYERIPLPAEKGWFVRVLEIRKNGLSTGSEIRLAPPRADTNALDFITKSDTAKEVAAFQDIDLGVPISDPNDDEIPNIPLFAQDEIFSPEVLTDSQAKHPLEKKIASEGESVIPAEGFWKRQKSLQMKKTNRSLSAKILWDDAHINAEENIIKSENHDFEEKEKSETVGDNTFAQEESVSVSNQLLEGSSLPSQKNNFSATEFMSETDKKNTSGIKTAYPVFRSDASKEHTVMVRATDSSGNYIEGDAYVSVKVPKILVSKNRLSFGEVSGHVEPRIGGIPFVVLRERNGKLKKLITSSADSLGKYVTDEYGDYNIADFSFLPGAVLRNRNGDQLAKIDAVTGKIQMSSPGVALVATTSGKTAAIYRETGRVLAEVVQVADGNSDVFLGSGEITLETPQIFSQGVSLFDRVPENDIRAGSLPGNAPFFPGGATIYQNENIIAVFSVHGEGELIDKNFSFRVKETESFELPIILELLNEYGRAQFDFFVQSVPNKMFLIEDDEPKRKIYSPKLFSKFPDSQNITADTSSDTSFIFSSISHFFSQNGKRFSLSSLLNMFQEAQVPVGDMCPEVPEDTDGIDDEDGCPEFDFEAQFTDVQSGIYLTPGHDDSPIPLLDFWADIRPGDKIFTAVSSEDDSEIYSQSERETVSDTLFIAK